MTPSLYPTRRAVWLMAAGLPVTLLLVAFLPALWPLGAAWVAGLIGLIGLDTILAVKADDLSPDLDTPGRFFIGETAPVQVRVFSSAAPNRPEWRLSTNIRLDPKRDTILPARQGDDLTGRFDLEARRRGQGSLLTLWQRWQGPMGLIWRQRRDALDRHVPITPNAEAIQAKALEIYTRDALFGQKVQRLRGEGTEFDSLKEFLPGMDKRHIDWKHSARHNMLLVRDYRTERNHPIVFAFDSGHLMSEDVVDAEGQRLTKLDRAVKASLLTSYISLKSGDRVGLYAFDAKPYLHSPAVGGTRAFAHLQKLSADIDYSTHETNYTLGLSQLGQYLKRRTLIVVYTDFADSTQAELMIESMGRLLKRHIIIFVAFRNAGLDGLADRLPDNASDVTRAVVAETLLAERDLVLAKLKRMGVNVINADPLSLDIDVLGAYLSLKARNAI